MHSKEQPEALETLAPRSVEAQQIQRTRHKVFNAIGATINFGADVAEFTANASLYTITRTIKGIGSGFRAAMNGYQGKEFKSPFQH